MKDKVSNTAGYVVIGCLMAIVLAGTIKFILWMFSL